MIPWIDGASVGEPGHPLYIPPGQGSGRIDNPEEYRVLYAATDEAGAFGEAFSNKGRWDDQMFQSARLPGARRSLVEIEVDARVLDLDDARRLVDRSLRPSEVATPDRGTTQRWALDIFRKRRWDGVRWWSVRDARWTIVGLWATKPAVVSVTPLSLDHPAAVRAAEMLGRRA